MNYNIEMFKAAKGWTTLFEVYDEKVGGTVDLCNDSRLVWHLAQVGGAKGKRILELGSLEGAHTKTMCHDGAKKVIAIEGNANCFLRGLIVKEVFGMPNAQFIFADFCEYVENYKGEKFDFVSAAGVLYHQKNPAKLIHDLAKITDAVIVWSQVATENKDTFAVVNGYSGRWNVYQPTRSESFMGGLEEKAFWMFPDEMLRCFRDAGFTNIIQQDSPDNVNGKTICFVAKK